LNEGKRFEKISGEKGFLRSLLQTGFLFSGYVAQKLPAQRFSIDY